MRDVFFKGFGYFSNETFPFLFFLHTDSTVLVGDRFCSLLFCRTRFGAVGRIRLIYDKLLVRDDDVVSDKQLIQFPVQVSLHLETVPLFAEGDYLETDASIIEVIDAFIERTLRDGGDLFCAAVGKSGGKIGG